MKTNATQNGTLKNGTPHYVYTFEFTFNSRETYKAHVADWRLRLAAYVNGVKMAKVDEADLKKTGSGAAASNSHSRRVWNRGTARQLMAERVEMKKEAQRQYLAQKANAEASLPVASSAV